MLAEGEQFLVGALLHHLAVLYKHYPIGVGDRGQSVSDDDRRPSLRGRVQSSLHRGFAVEIQRGGSFIQ